MAGLQLVQDIMPSASGQLGKRISISYGGQDVKKMLPRICHKLSILDLSTTCTKYFIATGQSTYAHSYLSVYICMFKINF